MNTSPSAPRRATRPILVTLAALAVTAAVAWIVFDPAIVDDASAAPAQRGFPTGDGPVVIELFTSQGCSSCPPADRLLTRLGENPTLSTKVFPLAFHVDYWNYIGWTDPFSSERWSNRQRRYAQAFYEQPGLHAPARGRRQVGLRRLPGGQGRRADRQGPAGAAPRPGRPPPGSRRRCERPARDRRREADRGRPRPLELWVALYQKDLTTSVARGENADRTLRNDYVVRQLEKAFSVPAAAGSTGSGEVSLSLDSGWNALRPGGGRVPPGPPDPGDPRRRPRDARSDAVAPLTSHPFGWGRHPVGTVA